MTENNTKSRLMVLLPYCGALVLFNMSTGQMESREPSR